MVKIKGCRKSTKMTLFLITPPFSSTVLHFVFPETIYLWIFLLVYPAPFFLYMHFTPFFYYKSIFQRFPFNISCISYVLPHFSVIRSLSGNSAKHFCFLKLCFRCVWCYLYKSCVLLLPFLLLNVYSFKWYLWDSPQIYCFCEMLKYFIFNITQIW